MIYVILDVYSINVYMLLYKKSTKENTMSSSVTSDKVKETPRILLTFRRLEKYDTDVNSTFSLEELTKFIQDYFQDEQFSCSGDEIAVWFRNADHDRSGSIDINEAEVFLRAVDKKFERAMENFLFS